MNRQTTLWVLGIIFVVLLAATFMLGASDAIQSTVVKANIAVSVLP